MIRSSRPPLSRSHALLDELPEEQVPVALAALESVERDAQILKRLRERHPEMSEHELLESLTIIKRGREATKRIGAAFADADPDEIEREAVEAVRQVRRERTGGQRGSAIDPRAACELVGVI